MATSGPVKRMARGRRPNGALVSMADGKALAYALFKLQERAELVDDSHRFISTTLGRGDSVPGSTDFSCRVARFSHAVMT